MATQIVIVGGGLAAGKAAEELRTQGFDGSLTLVAAENELPYERPPLSKGYLTGADAREVIYVNDQAWYDDNRVDLRLGQAAESVDRQNRQVLLAGGGSVGYDALLLATGAKPRRLPIPGADFDGVLTLRTAADSDRLKSEIADGGRHLAVIGAGWIGLEVAAAARGYGNTVTVVEPQQTPLQAALGTELGGMFADLHREHGVDLRLGTGVEEIVVSEGRAVGVRTTGADRDVAADLVVMGVGAAPDIDLAERAGLAVDNGVLVDSSLRTSDENIWAAGDVANIEHPFLGHRIRVEHWGNALHSGPAAARSMLGQQVSYDLLPYFFTDQYDLGMEFTGLPEGAEELVYRGERAGREFIVFWLAGGRVVAGMNVNVWDVADDIAALVRSRAVVDRARLADPEVSLAELLPG